MIQDFIREHNELYSDPKQVRKLKVLGVALAKVLLERKLQSASEPILDAICLCIRVGAEMFDGNSCFFEFGNGFTDFFIVPRSDEVDEKHIFPSACANRTRLDAHNIQSPF